MAKTHYDPFYSDLDSDGEECSEYGYCGTLLSFEENNSTNRKDEVDCKKCIKAFEKADTEMKQHSENFANDCQGFLDSIEKNK